MLETNSALIVSTILHTSIQTILLLQLKQALNFLEGKSFGCNIECHVERDFHSQLSLLL